MIHNIDAIYDHGVFRPIEPLALPEGTRVHLRVEEESGSDQTTENLSEGPAATLLERLKNVAGSINDLPADSSTNLDRYLYGRPKR